MGLNVDLVQMLGVSDVCVCPACKQVTRTGYDDYDIECGNPNPSPGQWQLSTYCRQCEHEWKQPFRVSLTGDTVSSRTGP